MFVIIKNCLDVTILLTFMIYNYCQKIAALYQNFSYILHQLKYKKSKEEKNLFSHRKL